MPSAFIAGVLQAYDGPPPLDLGQLFSRTSFQPLLTLGVLIAAGLYLAGVRTMRRRGDAWSRGRTAAWLGGLLIVTYATEGGLAAYDDVLFSAHMAQHMLLSMVAPIPLALGAPVTLALRTLPMRPRRWLLALLHGPVGRALSSPLVGLGLFIVTPFALYFTGLYPASLEHDWVHVLIHVHILVVGCVFLWPILGLDPLPHRPPHWARLLALFMALPIHAFLGLAIMGASSPLAAAYYARVGRPWGGSPLSDQHLGGGLLWASGDLLAVALFLVVLVQWSRADDREAVREDRRLDRLEEEARIAQG